MSFKKKLSFTDYSFTLLDKCSRPLDFVVIMELSSHLKYEHLQKGALISFQNFPESNSNISGKFFLESDKDWKIEYIESRDHKQCIQDFMEVYIDLKNERPIKQLFIKTYDKNYLVTRFHHALGDFVSFMQWVKVQFTHKVEAKQKLTLKEYGGKRPVKSPYMYEKKADVFGKYRGSPASKRSWDTISIARPIINFKDTGFSYNDLLCTSIFEAVREYNQSKGIKDYKNCLYIPMNLRENSEKGFGNGSGRIKIYDRFNDQDSLEDKAKCIREQVNTCRDIGFWKMPTELGIFDKIPFFLGRILLNNIGMPLSEPGSLIFSHIDKLKNFEQVYSGIRSIATISQMHSSYPMNLVGNSYSDKTIITATWDPSIVSDLKMNMFLKTLESKVNKNIKAIG